MGQKYSIFRCTNCGHFLYAPIKQKTRMCPYCNRVIKIDHFHSQITKNLELTIEKIKYYNAGENLEDFLEAKKKTPDQIQELTLKGRHKPASYQRSIERRRKKRSMSKLKRILSNHFTKISRELAELERICEKHNLDFDWVREILTNLAKEGYITFPNPWSIKYIEPIPDTESLVQQQEDKSNSTTELSTQPKGGDKEIYTFIVKKIQHAPEGIKRKEIKDAIQAHGYPIEGVDQILDRLLNEGQIFEPKTDVLKWISF